MHNFREDKKEVEDYFRKKMKLMHYYDGFKLIKK